MYIVFVFDFIVQMASVVKHVHFFYVKTTIFLAFGEIISYLCIVKQRGIVLNGNNFQLKKEKIVMTKNVFEILYTRIESEYGVEATKNDFQVFCEGSEFTNVKDVIDLIETLPFLYQKECVELDQIEVTFDTSRLWCVLHYTLFFLVILSPNIK